MARNGGVVLGRLRQSFTMIFKNHLRSIIIKMFISMTKSLRRERMFERNYELNLEPDFAVYPPRQSR